MPPKKQIVREYKQKTLIHGLATFVFVTCGENRIRLLAF